MIHKLKILPKYFDEVALGNKNFEVRKNDRDFKKGDYLILREYNPDTKRYTGNELAKRVLYVLHGGQFGIEKDYVIMSIG